MSQEEQEQQEPPHQNLQKRHFFWDPQIFWTYYFFGHKIFFHTQIFFGANIFTDLKFYNLQRQANITYRVFQKKVPTFVLLISRLPKHLENWLCTFFNSPTFAESKNNNILILGFKLEKLLTKL